MNSSVEFSVVVPVHNEADNVRPFVAEIQTALNGVANYEIIYVDDGSSDSTPQELLEAMKECDCLRVIRHREAAGQSAALATGVRFARGHWIVTLDGDGQNDPADIPALLARMRGHGHAADLQLVCGHRERRRDNRMKRLSSRIANGVRRRALSDGTLDTGCGLKVFSRDLFLSLPQFDHMHRFLPALVQSAGGRVISVKVNHRPRLRGKTHYGVRNRLWTGIIDLFGVMWLRRRIKHTTAVEVSQPGIARRMQNQLHVRG